MTKLCVPVLISFLIKLSCQKLSFSFVLLTTVISLHNLHHKKNVMVVYSFTAQEKTDVTLSFYVGVCGMMDMTDYGH